MKRYLFVLCIEIVIAIVISFITGLNALNVFNQLFLVALFLLCVGLLLFMYSNGAFSIMGHSFRKFHYRMAPKRVKEAMDEDPAFDKELHIRQEQYVWTFPILFTSLAVVVLSIVAMYFV
ncbi:DUF3899 domain-containing protein [Macrococcus capreoli]|uniref:DUF3899 domain-containing protein n=1 Tax=Macrococcus capreoli TaxID=2982690 RepID=UPI003EE78E76